MHVRQKTDPGMLPQFQALESNSADKPEGGHEMGVGRVRAPGVQHGREERGRESSVTPARGDRRVSVLDKRGNPLMPTSPARTCQLLRSGRAVVARHTPFVIRLKDRDGGEVQPVRLGVDPGSKTTGMALTRQSGGTRHVLFLLEVTHRSQEIHKKMQQRASYRSGRRSRNLRYRAPRFLNRTKPAGWLAPSLRSRVQHVETWLRRLATWCPVAAVDLELVRFDTHLMSNPEVSGIGYQYGTLHGYEVREWVFEKWGRKCVYCDAENVPLNIDHVRPKSRGVSDRPSNLAPACIPCNQHKGSRLVEDFAPDRAAKIIARGKVTLRDAAAVNSTRFACLAALRQIGVPVECWSGGRTKWNRHRTRTPKTHALDAACVGRVDRLYGQASAALAVKAMGRGVHCRTSTDAYGFPRLRLPRTKLVHGFQTGDLVRAVVPNGSHVGRHIGRVAVRRRGSFRVGKADGINYKHCTVVQRGDGYAY